ncbi:MAG: hypothetical protein Q7R43_05480 [Candidatus Daviesbacteria bacterium]|nr:hypothetical protein [Candidatus Daviesbacteria bacterium]
MRKVFLVLSSLFLIYLILPGPSKISDFKPLPDAMVSDLSGDTWQVENVVGYFSNNYRDFATSLYYQNFRELNFLPFPPLKLNHPPEYAYQYIKDQTDSTYLEEYFYPLRGSLFVNGFEPFEEDSKAPRWRNASKFFTGSDHEKETKVTLRYDHVPLHSRILVWLAINLSVIYLWKLGKKAVQDD